MRLFAVPSPRILTVVLSALAVACACAPSARAQASGASVTVTLTSADLREALSAMPPVQFAPGSPQNSVIDVNADVRYQRVDGFGAALTDSSAWLIYDKLSASKRAQAMSSLFGPTGLHLTFLRIPVGASDFSATGIPYSYDDEPAEQSAPTLTAFSVAHDKAYIIPVLRQTLDLDPHVEILASSWSSPAWMKANHLASNVGGSGTLLAYAYQPLASYFVKFIQAYRAAGIPIWGLTPQNEPSAHTRYPGMELPAVSEATFITDFLSPALVAAGLRTRVFGLDGIGVSFAQTLETAAGGQLAGIAWHCYGGMNELSVFHVLHPTVPEIVSECSPGIIPYSTAEVLIDATRNWASSVALWNLALNPVGGPVQPPDSGCPHCTGVITVDEHTHSFSYTSSYFQLGQFSKFVKPGAVRIASNTFASEFHAAPAPHAHGYGITTGLEDVAFENPDGQLVLIAYSHASVPEQFTVNWQGDGFSYTLPAGATVTFTWR